MAVTITNEDLQYILSQVLNAIRSESQSVDELPTVDSLTGINSLPALQGQTVVKAPVSLLGQPAVAAASVANSAAINANDKALLAQQATITAQQAATSADNSAQAADKAAKAADLAAQNANTASQSAVRKITVKNKKGETIDQLTPGAGGNVDLIMTGDGSGSGFYNVTLLHPQSGFYTKETAIAAVVNAGIENETKPGMIITFEASPGKWLDFRFEGTDIGNFPTPAAWNPYGGGNAVKKVTVSKGTDTDELIPDAGGNILIDIPIVKVDKTLTENGTNPVEGGAVLKAISELENQFGISIVLNTIVDGDDKAYSLSLLDVNGNVLNTTETFTSGGGSGSAVGTRVILTRITENPTVKYGDTVKLQFLYDQIDTSNNSSTGNAAKAAITIVFGATSSSFEFDIAAGSTTTLDVTKYLGVGNNTVRVRIVTNDETAQVSSVSWTVRTVQLVLSSSFNVASVIQRGTAVSVPFALTGSGDKTLRMYTTLVHKLSFSNN